MCAVSPEPKTADSACEPRHGPEESSVFISLMKRKPAHDLATQVTTDNCFEAREQEDPIWPTPVCTMFEKISVPMQQHVQIFTPYTEQYAAHTDSSYNSLSADAEEVPDYSLSVPIKVEVDAPPMYMGSSTQESSKDEHFGQASRPAVNQDQCSPSASQKAGPSLTPLHAERSKADRPNTEDDILSRNAVRAKRLTSVWRASQKLVVSSSCNRVLPRSSRLEEHRTTHQPVKPFRCLECGKSFTQKTRLKTHQSVHTGERPFGCKICGKRFSRQDNCLRHERFHTGAKPYSCGQCGKSFTVLGNLKIHQEIHLQGR